MTKVVTITLLLVNLYCGMSAGVFYGNALEAITQSPDHWETIIYNDDTWRYRTGTSEPPTNWMQPTFDDSQWAQGIGGFGYGDGDDNTLISNVLSFYMRRDFELVDTSVISFLILHADYDDAFVAYLNGVEIARSNFGVVGTPPLYNETPDSDHEASLYQGGTPENYTLFGSALKALIKEDNNTLAIQVHNVEIGSSDFTSNFFLSVGIEDTSMNYGETPDWFSAPLFETNLPLIVIGTTQTTQIFDEPRVPAHMGIVDNGPGQINSIFDDYNAYDGDIFIEIRGASSQGFPKKNYGFETRLPDGSNNNVSLLGMPEENDWVLHGPFADKSLLRNVLAYHMGATTGQYTPRTRLCELIVNGDYRGVYILTERIKQDDNRVDIAKLKPEDIAGDELTGGYIVQIDRDDGDIPNDGWVSDFPDFKFWAFDSPDYDEIMPAQSTYIQDYINDFESTMNSVNYTTEYKDFVDVDSWVDYFLVTEMGKHIDAFKLSFYMHKKKDSNGGKLHFGPLWDFNLGFGNFDFACSPDPEGWSYLFRGTCDNWHPFWVKRLAEIPQVKHQTNCRWFELREGLLSTDSLMQFIDENATLLEEAQVRNFARWPILGEYVWPNDFIGDTYAEEIGFLKSWLTERLTWMDNNMFGDCDLLDTDLVEINPKRRVEVYPNPAYSHLFVNVYDVDFREVKMELYDLLGNKIVEYNILQPETNIELSHLADGIYIYRVWDGVNLVGENRLVKIGLGN